MKKYYDYIKDNLDISVKYIEYNISEEFYKKIEKNT